MNGRLHRILWGHARRPITVLEPIVPADIATALAHFAADWPTDPVPALLDAWHAERTTA